MNTNRRGLLRSLVNTPARGSASLGAAYYTNARLRTHQGDEVRFYDDLVKDKLVVVNFMYAHCSRACPRTTANLVKVQQALGSRVGRDVFMYSITLKPEEDSPQVLAQYAAEHRVGPGWLFLTGDEHDITTLRFKLFRWDHPKLDLDIEQHTGMVRIINDPIDRWSMCPTFARTRQIVAAIGWAERTKPYDVRLRENVARQAEIDAESLGQRAGL
jgi:protein SCO1